MDAQGASWPKLLAVLAVALFGFVLARAVRAEPRVGPVDRPVVVKVMVVHARQQPGIVDPLCEDLRKKLRLMNFRSLRVVQQQSFKLRMGEQGAMQLPEGRRLEFLPISVIGGELHMQVMMPGVVNTRMRMANRRGVILGGVRYGDGVLVVQLQPTFRLPRGPSAAAREARERRRARTLRTAGP
ncbi:MAG: hypothetical protein ACE5FG_05085 [Myxococcota bacterium]